MWTSLLLIIFAGGLDAVIHDSYSGKPATRNQIETFEKRNNTQYCLIDVKPCEENEWRRVNGACTNLKYPSRGMMRTPTRRVLTPDFSPNYDSRKAKDDTDLPLSRPTRNNLLADGKATDLKTTQLLSFFLVFQVNDMNSGHDAINYIFNTTNCCKPEGKSNYICTPIKIPKNDPVHRFSGRQCQNLTRPQSFQYFGCINFGTEFKRMVFVTPVLDLSTVYEYGELGIIDKIRTYSKGLLKVEIENDKAFPPSHPSEDPVINKCILNQLPREKRCHLYTSNTVVGTNILTILFYRQHNYISKKLDQMNPCWSDDRLFYTAKDINIAIYAQIYYCEVLPILLGRNNLIKEGLACPEGFRDMYDENEVPEVSDEYVYINRWFHTIQNADIKLYDEDGYFLNSMVITNVTLRTGWLPLDNNMDRLFQGTFRHPGAKVDHIIDPELGQDILQGINFASDIATNDLEKGRLFGFPPYVKYREFCAKKPYKTFASLSDVMKEERIHRLTQLYDNVEDVDLMAGVWSENRIHGGMVPYTVYCLLVEQVKRTIAMDRHWYERPNRPHAFTLDQLKAIRKATIAGVMCTNADGVTKIQRNAFKTISPDNPLTDCKSSKIGNVDFTAWQDPQCNK